MKIIQMKKKLIHKIDKQAIIKGNKTESYLKEVY